jgi:hypothetical protein
MRNARQTKTVDIPEKYEPLATPTRLVNNRLASNAFRRNGSAQLGKFKTRLRRVTVPALRPGIFTGASQRQALASCVLIGRLAS